MLLLRSDQRKQRNYSPSRQKRKMFLYRLCLLVETLAYFTTAQTLTVSLQRVRPAASDQACPGNEVVFTCIVTSPHFAQIHPFLIWVRPQKPNSLKVIYHMGMQHSAPLGDIATNAVFKNDYYTIISNATIKPALLLHSNTSISCYTPSLAAYLTEHIKIAGTDDSPSKLSAAVSSTEPQVLALTWLPPSSYLNCSFNYTVNITNSSSVTDQMYINNSTSLILTDLTRGENYSFAVAVTDSTGQHGPWSEELIVTWDAAAAAATATTTTTTTATTTTTTTTTAAAAATAAATITTTLHAAVTITTTTTFKVVPVSSSQHTFQFFVGTPFSSPNGTENKKLEDLFVHIISFSSGLLLICISLLAAICIVLLCVQKRNTKKHMTDHIQQEVECSGDAKVVYDVPIFKNYQENQSEFQNSGKMSMHQNAAYDYTYPSIDGDGKVHIHVSTNKLEGPLGLQDNVTDRELFIEQNIAYEHVPTH